MNLASRRESRNSREQRENKENQQFNNISMRPAAQGPFTSKNSKLMGCSSHLYSKVNEQAWNMVKEDLNSRMPKTQTRFKSRRQEQMSQLTD